MTPSTRSFRQIILTVILMLGLAASHQAARKSSANVVFTLQDGSRLLGVARFTELSISNQEGSHDLQLGQINHIQFTNHTTTATVFFVNGDTIQGAVAKQKLSLTGLFGTVRIDVHQIDRIDSLPIDVVSTNQLVAYFSFDTFNNDGVSIADKGKPLTAILRNATAVSDGVQGGAVRCGGGSHVEIPYDPSLDFGTGDFSYCLWFKADQLGATQQLYWHSYNPEIQIQPDGTLAAYYAYLFCGATGTQTTVDAGNWHFVAMTRSNGTGIVYLDGKREVTVPAVDCVCSSPDSVILGDDTVFDERFSGLIDEVRIWQRALSDNEVSLLYNSVNPNK